MEDAVLQELRDYAARREGGRTPQAEALVQKAARTYVATVRALNRFGGADRRFWDVMGDLSEAFDAILFGYAGDADYYLTGRQWDELVVPALRCTGPSPARGMPPLQAQLSQVGDLVIHTHCEALSVEQQRTGLAELARVLRQAPADDYATTRYCIVTGVAKLLFMKTDRDHNTDDFSRCPDAGLAAEAARQGLLKAALEAVADSTAMPGMEAMANLPPSYAAMMRNEQEHHVVQAAQSMLGGLLVTGDTSTVATAGRWAAEQKALVKRLLQKLRTDPRGLMASKVVLATLRLVVQLAAVSPPLLDVFNQGGLSQLIDRLQNSFDDPSDVAEVVGWADILYRYPAGTRVTLATMWQRCVYEGLTRGTADAAAMRDRMGGNRNAAGGSSSSSGAGSSSQTPAPQQAQRAQQEVLSRAEIAALPVRELKQRLAAAGIDSRTCVDKGELVDLLAESMPAVPTAVPAGEGSSTGNGQHPAGSSQQQQQEQQQGEGAAPAGKRCSCCGAAKAAGVKLRLCGGCRKPGLYFCGIACQKQLWPGHKEECKAAQQRQKEEEEEEQ